MLYALLFFSLQNAVCFIMLTSLVPVLVTFYIQVVLKLKKKNNSGAIGLKGALGCKCPPQLKKATNRHCPCSMKGNPSLLGGALSNLHFIGFSCRWER